jgi:hypothetical protein
VERRLLDDYQFDPAQMAALNRLTHEIEKARYAPPDEELGRSAEDRMADVAAVIAAVAEAKPAPVRRRAQLWPQSGMETLAGFGYSVNSAAERLGRRLGSLGPRVKGKSDGGPQTAPEAGSDAASNAGFSPEDGGAGKEKVGSGQL